MMFGRIHIESPEEHAAWMQANTPVDVARALAR